MGELYPFPSPLFVSNVRVGVGVPVGEIVFPLMSSIISHLVAPSFHCNRPRARPRPRARWKGDLGKRVISASSIPEEAASAKGNGELMRDNALGGFFRKEGPGYYNIR